MKTDTVVLKLAIPQNIKQTKLLIHLSATPRYIPRKTEREVHMKPMSTNADNGLCATDKTWELKIALHGQTECGISIY